ncbi:hypothetical protein BH24PSE2_BH24PSE2_17540 [soil metagenome]
MSVLDQVREKYKTPRDETCKSSKSPSAAFAGPQDKHSETFAGVDLAGLTIDDLRLEAEEDWSHVAADRLRLEAFARAVRTTRQRERGEIPAHYTATTTCRGCGPVPIWPGAPEHVDGCPWCFNRARGLPMPRKERRK